MGRDTEFNFGHNVAPELAQQGVPALPKTPQAVPWRYLGNLSTVDCPEPVVCEKCKKFIGYHGELAKELENLRRETEVLKDLIRTGGLFDEVAIDYPARPFQLITDAWQRGQPLHEWSDNMDLKNFRGTDSRKKFERLEFIQPEDLPRKGAAKWKIIAERPTARKIKGILGFIDLQNGKKKRAMALRKGFTLDALMDELGTKTEKWVGKTISLMRGGNDGQYVNLA